MAIKKTTARGAIKKKTTRGATKKKTTRSVTKKKIARAPKPLGSEKLEIAKATESELPQIARLAGMLVRQHHAFDSKRFLFIDDPESGYEWWFAKELRNKQALILRAKLGRKIVGYAYARQEPRDWNALLDAHAALHDILVEESARRRGIGRLLLQGVIDEMAARGTPRVVLHTAVQNESAHRMFEAAGFRRTMLEMTREL